jgi:hypothetical protein
MIINVNVEVGDRKEFCHKCKYLFGPIENPMCALFGKWLKLADGSMPTKLDDCLSATRVEHE